MKTSLRVNKLNRLLESELGTPVYNWVWSEDLVIGVQAIESDGSPKRDWRPDPKTGLMLPRPVYITHKITRARKCWVLCRKLLPPTEYRWRQQFGTAMEYPNTGFWTPCEGAKGPVATQRNTEPTLDDTSVAIRMIRAERSLPVSEVTAGRIAAQDKARRDSLNRMIDEFRDAAPAFGGVPGSKTHWSPTGLGKDKSKWQSPMP